MYKWDYVMVCYEKVLSSAFVSGGNDALLVLLFEDGCVGADCCASCRGDLEWGGGLNYVLDWHGF